ncbi:MAG: 50S ribosomal protein L5 [Patescibacteria group bacterium]
MHKILEKYNKEIIPALKKTFGYKNVMAIPKLEKLVINVGLGSGLKDDKYVELVEKTLTGISGQKPVRTKARKAIAGFKIREGMEVGVKVSLRGDKMYDFIDKLVNVTFPRVRDFWGISEKLVDSKGNLSIGFKEHTVFPEIAPEEVDRPHGLQINIKTTAGNHKEGLELFKLLGFPFKKDNK